MTYQARVSLAYRLGMASVHDPCIHCMALANTCLVLASTYLAISDLWLKLS